MSAPLLYRRRFIPMETVHLKDDEILQYTDEIIITKWNTLRPRIDFDCGYSCVFLKKNIKVSKLFKNGKFIYYYCDIVDAVFSAEDNSYVINDLLVDVVVMPDGFVKVLDVGELTYAFDRNIITYDIMRTALNTLDLLLEVIYGGEFGMLTKYVDEIA